MARPGTLLCCSIWWNMPGSSSPKLRCSTRWRDGRHGHGAQNCIRELRRLVMTSKAHALLVTVHRRGYRFLPPSPLPCGFRFRFQDLGAEHRPTRNTQLKREHRSLGVSERPAVAGWRKLLQGERQPETSRANPGLARLRRGGVSSDTRRQTPTQTEFMAAEGSASSSMGRGKHTCQFGGVGPVVPRAGEESASSHCCNSMRQRG
jgi:hypothetical protein